MNLNMNAMSALNVKNNAGMYSGLQLAIPVDGIDLEADFMNEDIRLQHRHERRQAALAKLQQRMAEKQQQMMMSGNNNGGAHTAHSSFGNEASSRNFSFRGMPNSGFYVSSSSAAQSPTLKTNGGGNAIASQQQSASSFSFAKGLEALSRLPSVRSPTTMATINQSNSTNNRNSSSSAAAAIVSGGAGDANNATHFTVPATINNDASDNNNKTHNEVPDPSNPKPLRPSQLTPFSANASPLVQPVTAGGGANNNSRENQNKTTATTTDSGGSGGKHEEVMFYAKLANKDKENGHVEEQQQPQRDPSSDLLPLLRATSNGPLSGGSCPSTLTLEQQNNSSNPPSPSSPPHQPQQGNNGGGSGGERGGGGNALSSFFHDIPAVHSVHNSATSSALQPPPAGTSITSSSSSPAATAPPLTLTPPSIAADEAKESNTNAAAATLTTTTTVAVENAKERHNHQEEENTNNSESRFGSTWVMSPAELAAHAETAAVNATASASSPLAADGGANNSTSRTCSRAMSPSSLPSSSTHALRTPPLRPFATTPTNGNARTSSTNNNENNNSVSAANSATRNNNTGSNTRNSNNNIVFGTSVPFTDDNEGEATITGTEPGTERSETMLLSPSDDEALAMEDHHHDRRHHHSGSGGSSSSASAAVSSSDASHSDADTVSNTPPLGFTGRKNKKEKKTKEGGSKRRAAKGNKKQKPQTTTEDTAEALGETDTNANNPLTTATTATATTTAPSIPNNASSSADLDLKDKGRRPTVSGINWGHHTADGGGDGTNNNNMNNTNSRRESSTCRDVDGALVGVEDHRQGVVALTSQNFAQNINNPNRVAQHFGELKSQTAGMTAVAMTMGGAGAGGGGLDEGGDGGGLRGDAPLVAALGSSSGEDDEGRGDPTTAIHNFIAPAEYEINSNASDGLRTDIDLESVPFDEDDADESDDGSDDGSLRSSVSSTASEVTRQQIFHDKRLMKQSMFNLTLNATQNANNNSTVTNNHNNNNATALFGSSTKLSIGIDTPPASMFGAAGGGGIVTSTANINSITAATTNSRQNSMIGNQNQSQQPFAFGVSPVTPNYDGGSGGEARASAFNNGSNGATTPQSPSLPSHLMLSNSEGPLTSGALNINATNSAEQQQRVLPKKRAGAIGGNVDQNNGSITADPLSATVEGCRIVNDTTIMRSDHDARQKNLCGGEIVADWGLATVNDDPKQRQQEQQPPHVSQSPFCLPTPATKATATASSPRDHNTTTDGNSNYNSILLQSGQYGSGTALKFAETPLSAAVGAKSGKSSYADPNNNNSNTMAAGAKPTPLFLSADEPPSSSDGGLVVAPKRGGNGNQAGGGGGGSSSAASSSPQQSPTMLRRQNTNASLDGTTANATTVNNLGGSRKEASSSAAGAAANDDSNANTMNGTNMKARGSVLGGGLIRRSSTAFMLGADGKTPILSHHHHPHGHHHHHHDPYGEEFDDDEYVEEDEEESRPETPIIETIIVKKTALDLTAEERHAEAKFKGDVFAAALLASKGFAAPRPPTPPAAFLSNSIRQMSEAELSASTNSASVVNNSNSVAMMARKTSAGGNVFPPNLTTASTTSAGSPNNQLPSTQTQPPLISQVTVPQDSYYQGNTYFQNYNLGGGGGGGGGLYGGMYNNNTFANNISSYFGGSFAFGSSLGGGGGGGTRAPKPREVTIFFGSFLKQLPIPIAIADHMRFIEAEAKAIYKQCADRDVAILKQYEEDCRRAKAAAAAAASKQRELMMASSSTTHSVTNNNKDAAASTAAVVKNSSLSSTTSGSAKRFINNLFSSSKASSPEAGNATAVAAPPPLFTDTVDPNSGNNNNTLGSSGPDSAPNLGMGSASASGVYSSIPHVEITSTDNGATTTTVVAGRNGSNGPMSSSLTGLGGVSSSNRLLTNSANNDNSPASPSMLPRTLSAMPHLRSGRGFGGGASGKPAKPLPAFAIRVKITDRATITGADIIEAALQQLFYGSEAVSCTTNGTIQKQSSGRAASTAVGAAPSAKTTGWDVAWMLPGGDLALKGLLAEAIVLAHQVYQKPTATADGGGAVVKSPQESPSSPLLRGDGGGGGLLNSFNNKASSPLRSGNQLLGSPSPFKTAAAAEYSNPINDSLTMAPLSSTTNSIIVNAHETKAANGAEAPALPTAAQIEAAYATAAAQFVEERHREVLQAYYRTAFSHSVDDYLIAMADEYTGEEESPIQPNSVVSPSFTHVLIKPLPIAQKYLYPRFQQCFFSSTRSTLSSGLSPSLASSLRVSAKEFIRLQDLRERTARLAIAARVSGDGGSGSDVKAANNNDKSTTSSHAFLASGADLPLATNNNTNAKTLGNEGDANSKRDATTATATATASKSSVDGGVGKQTPLSPQHLFEHTMQNAGQTVAAALMAATPPTPTPADSLPLTEGVSPVRFGSGLSPPMSTGATPFSGGGGAAAGGGIAFVSPPTSETLNMTVTPSAAAKEPEAPKLPMSAADVPTEPIPSSDPAASLLSADAAVTDFRTVQMRIVHFPPDFIAAVCRIVRAQQLASYGIITAAQQQAAANNNEAAPTTLSSSGRSSFDGVAAVGAAGGSGGNCVFGAQFSSPTSLTEIATTASNHHHHHHGGGISVPALSTTTNAPPPLPSSVASAAAAQIFASPTASTFNVSLQPPPPQQRRETTCFGLFGAMDMDNSHQPCAPLPPLPSEMNPFYANMCSVFENQLLLAAAYGGDGEEGGNGEAAENNNGSPAAAARAIVAYSAGGAASPPSLRSRETDDLSVSNYSHNQSPLKTAHQHHHHHHPQRQQQGDHHPANSMDNNNDSPILTVARSNNTGLPQTSSGAELAGMLFLNHQASNNNAANHHHNNGGGAIGIFALSRTTTANNSLHHNPLTMGHNNTTNAATTATNGHGLMMPLGGGRATTPSVGALNLSNTTPTHNSLSVGGVRSGGGAFNNNRSYHGGAGNNASSVGGAGHFHHNMHATATAADGSSSTADINKVFGGCLSTLAASAVIAFKHNLDEDVKAFAAESTENAVKEGSAAHNHHHPNYHASIAAAAASSSAAAVLGGGGAGLSYGASGLLTAGSISPSTGGTAAAHHHQRTHSLLGGGSDIGGSPVGVGGGGAKKGLGGFGRSSHMDLFGEFQPTTSVNLTAVGGGGGALLSPRGGAPSALTHTAAASPLRPSIPSSYSTSPGHGANEFAPPTPSATAVTVLPSATTTAASPSAFLATTTSKAGIISTALQQAQQNMLLCAKRMGGDYSKQDLSLLGYGPNASSSPSAGGSGNGNNGTNASDPLNRDWWAASASNSITTTAPDGSSVLVVVDAPAPSYLAKLMPRIILPNEVASSVAGHAATGSVHHHTQSHSSGGLVRGGSASVNNFMGRSTTSNSLFSASTSAAVAAGYPPLPSVQIKLSEATITPKMGPTGTNISATTVDTAEPSGGSKSTAPSPSAAVSRKMPLAANASGSDVVDSPPNLEFGATVPPPTNNMTRQGSLLVPINELSEGESAGPASGVGSNSANNTSSNKDQQNPVSIADEENEDGKLNNTANGGGGGSSIMKQQRSVQIHESALAGGAGWGGSSIRHTNNTNASFMSTNAINGSFFANTLTSTSNLQLSHGFNFNTSLMPSAAATAMAAAIVDNYHRGAMAQHIKGLVEVALAAADAIESAAIMTPSAVNNSPLFSGGANGVVSLANKTSNNGMLLGQASSSTPMMTPTGLPPIAHRREYSAGAGSSGAVTPLPSNKGGMNNRSTVGRVGGGTAMNCCKHQSSPYSGSFLGEAAATGLPSTIIPTVEEYGSILLKKNTSQAVTTEIILDPSRLIEVYREALSIKEQLQQANNEYTNTNNTGTKMPRFKSSQQQQSNFANGGGGGGVVNHSTVSGSMATTTAHGKGHQRIVSGGGGEPMSVASNTLLYSSTLPPLGGAAAAFLPSNSPSSYNIMSAYGSPTAAGAGIHHRRTPSNATATSNNNGAAGPTGGGGASNIVPTTAHPLMPLSSLLSHIPPNTPMPTVKTIITMVAAGHPLRNKPILPGPLSLGLIQTVKPTTQDGAAAERGKDAATAGGSTPISVAALGSPSAMSGIGASSSLAAMPSVSSLLSPFTGGLNSAYLNDTAIAHHASHVLTDVNRAIVAQRYLPSDDVMMMLELRVRLPSSGPLYKAYVNTHGGTGIVTVRRAIMLPPELTADNLENYVLKEIGIDLDLDLAVKATNGGGIYDPNATQCPPSPSAAAANGNGRANTTGFSEEFDDCDEHSGLNDDNPQRAAEKLKAKQKADKAKRALLPHMLFVKYGPLLELSVDTPFDFFASPDTSVSPQPIFAPPPPPHISQPQALPSPSMAPQMGGNLPSPDLRQQNSQYTLNRNPSMQNMQRQSSVLGGGGGGGGNENDPQQARFNEALSIHLTQLQQVHEQHERMIAEVTLNARSSSTMFVPMIRDRTVFSLKRLGVDALVVDLTQFPEEALKFTISLLTADDLVRKKTKGMRYGGGGSQSNNTSFANNTTTAGGSSLDVSGGAYSSKRTSGMDVGGGAAAPFNNNNRTSVNLNSLLGDDDDRVTLQHGNNNDHYHRRTESATIPRLQIGDGVDNNSMAGSASSSSGVGATGGGGGPFMIPQSKLEFWLIEQCWYTPSVANPTAMTSHLYTKDTAVDEQPFLELAASSLIGGYGQGAGGGTDLHVNGDGTGAKPAVVTAYANHHLLVQQANEQVPLEKGLTEAVSTIMEGTTLPSIASPYNHILAPISRNNINALICRDFLSRLNENNYRTNTAVSSVIDGAAAVAGVGGVNGGLSPARGGKLGGGGLYTRIDEEEARAYQHFEVIKTNKYGTEQERVIGIDGERIYNMRPSTEASNKTKNPERNVSDIEIIRTFPDRPRYFEIEYKREVRFDTDRIMCKSVEDCVLMVEKLKVLKKMAERKLRGGKGGVGSVLGGAGAGSANDATAALNSTRDKGVLNRVKNIFGFGLSSNKSGK